eukprot:5226438-Pleurochrysis_carterae.AAC.6
MRVRAHGNIERRGGVEVCGVRGRLPLLVDRRLNFAIEGKRLGRLTSAQRGPEGGEADSLHIGTGSPGARMQGSRRLATACGLALSAVRRGDRLTHTCLDGRSIARGERAPLPRCPARQRRRERSTCSPDLARCMIFALERGDFTPQRRASEPRQTLRQVRTEFGLAKATDVQNAHRGIEASAKERGFGQGGGGNQAVKQVMQLRALTPRKQSLVTACRATNCCWRTSTARRSCSALIISLPAPIGAPAELV